MALLKAKQIEKLLNGYARANSFSANGGSNDVTAAITTVLSTASNSGGSVPVQPSTGNNTEGVKVGGTYIVAIIDSTTKDKIQDNGNEVYGRLTEAAGVYTLTYYTNDAGTETPYSFASATDIDFEFIYNFTFKDLPADATTSISTRNVQDDPSVGSGTPVVETVSVTALNTLAALTQTPNSLPIKLDVNGKTETNLAGGAFTNSGTTLTWNSVVAGYDLETTDRVVASYYTF